MAKRTSKALERKTKVEEKIKSLEQELKELEQKSFEEVGRFVFKEWEINNEIDSETIFEVISSLKSEAQSILKSDEVQDELGKSEE